MTEKEYMERIEAIRRQIAGNQLSQVKDRLEEMFSFKPVRLLWYVAKAEYILKSEHDPEAALSVLDKKYFPGADYPGMKECMKVRTKALKLLGRNHDVLRENYLYQKSRGGTCVRPERDLSETIERFCDVPEDTEALAALGAAFYHTSDLISYFIVREELIRRGYTELPDEGAWVGQIANYGYLREKLHAEQENVFILVMGESLDRTLEVLGFILHSFGHKVFLLTPPLSFETEEQLDLADTLDISWEQMEPYPDMCVIHPVLLTQDGIPYGDNREYIIDRICRKESGRDYSILLCNGNLLENLYVRNGLRRRMGRLSSYETDLQETKTQFSWVGDYLSYISDIYKYDVRADIDVAPEVDFSILIPARNSAATLRYTLETCLNQRYRGSYEIVVSDNSVKNATEVYDLCQELNNPKIRYIKAPRQLDLTKSFEFGYLQTRGEFIISMGSDDGLLPWGLETLRTVLDQFPEEEIIAWERGFYAWPGFNGGQENQFIIPRRYDKGNLSIGFVETASLFQQLAQDPQMIYGIPTLYINSGFRRKYMKTLLEKTGKLWPGINQDVYTGIVNCCIHKRILMMIYPITIAGMSSGSVGYLMSVSKTAEKTEGITSAYNQLIISDNMNSSVRLARERILCSYGVDITTLYLTLSRAVEDGLLSEMAADQILDWKTAVSKAFQGGGILNDAYDALLHQERFFAQQMGDDSGSWFDESVYKNVLCPKYIEKTALEQRRKQRTYQEEVSLGGSEVLDASRFSVHNIADAVNLFARRVNL